MSSLRRNHFSGSTVDAAHGIRFRKGTFCPPSRDPLPPRTGNMPILPQRTDPSRKAPKTCATASILPLPKSTRCPPGSRRVHEPCLVQQLNDLSDWSQAPCPRIIRAAPSSTRILPGTAPFSILRDAFVHFDICRVAAFEVEGPVFCLGEFQAQALGFAV